ncbi:hypothetical protein D516_2030 [Rhodobacter sp. AKP1]|nr:Hypothetical Protein RSKD131_0617 [Cereibacter sphaeroides KD131]EKX56913.1 hypothetical protein D516_2030 [Rhodobacter sp. AKP1]
MASGAEGGPAGQRHCMARGNLPARLKFRGGCSRGLAASQP